MEECTTCVVGFAMLEIVLSFLLMCLGELPSLEFHDNVNRMAYDNVNRMASGCRCKSSSYSINGR